MGKPFGPDTVIGITGNWPERQQSDRWKEIAADRRLQVEAANAYREEMIADGWHCFPTYPHEALTRHATLTKEGFHCHLTARPEDDRSLPVAGASFWGPDGISLEAPFPYDWDKLVAGVRTCPECQATDVDTVRVAFANRSCKSCAPALRAKLERPGWCD